MLLIFRVIKHYHMNWQLILPDCCLLLLWLAASPLLSKQFNTKQNVVKISTSVSSSVVSVRLENHRHNNVTTILQLKMRSKQTDMMMINNILQLIIIISSIKHSLLQLLMFPAKIVQTNTAPDCTSLFHHPNASF